MVQKLKLGAKGTKWLKFFHIIFAAIWFGAGVSIMIISILGEQMAGELGPQIAMTGAVIIGDYLITPMIAGVVITGLLYSIFTDWGFFKYHWITVKWILTAVLVVLIFFVMDPSKPVTAAVIGNLQLLMFFFMFFISIFKPWGQRKSNKLEESKQVEQQ